MKKVFALLLAAAMMFGIAACQTEPDGTQGVADIPVAAADAVPPATGMFAALEAIYERFPMATPVAEGIGGVMNFALVTNSHFAGIFNPAFSITADDGTINDFMFEFLLAVNAGNMYGFNGPAWYEIDREAATFTLHFHDDVQMYWHDGVPVTMYDLEYTVMMVCHPDTYSDRFGAALNTSTIKGVDEFRAGTADHISGIRVFNDGRSLEYSFESVNPSMLFGGVWTRPLPKHRFETVPFAEQREHPYSRSDIVGNGPFMFQSVVPGEAVTMVANPNYWMGAPNLDGLNIAVIHPDLIGEAMIIGTFDLCQFPTVHVPDYEQRLNNATLLAALDRRFDFMGFRFGTMDHDAQTFTHNPDTIINCISLRQALAYARDDATPAATIHDGMRFPISTTIIPWQGDFLRTDMVGFSIFDLDLANEILDEAGYEWRDGEKYRRHKDSGEHFQLVWAIHENPTNPLIVPHNIQNWEKVGLEVVLYTGGLMEFNDRIETLTHDLDEGQIHFYDAAWLFGTNPNPRGLWGVSSHNDTRYESPRLHAIMDAISSDQAWDQEWLIEQYYEWQLAVFEEAPWIPVTTGIQLWLANDRVLNFSLERGDGRREISLDAWHFWDLSQDTPFRAR